ncbi:Hypothetical protein R9X50_00242400 [Acrodontium crateriforme]|uniref:ethanolamine kinase n=1 Tax=Acrodontium crateriforme TaxID=150365 RepID=A0AAQ3M0T8_9PEZI|nr:Hypothetical protein R9X50_00242400 [Acrodontium crateriforme]
MSSSTEFRADTPLQLQHIPFTFDSQRCDESAIDLVEALNPDWKNEDGPITLKKFTDGITNTLMKATKERPSQTASENEDDSVLIRTYGEGTDALIDRERELRSHSLLATLGLAPPLLARFNNGLMYRFIQGTVCTPEDLRRPEVYRAVAKRLGQWHGLLPISAISTTSRADNVVPKSNGVLIEDESSPIPNLWTVTQSWIEALPSTTETEKERNAMLSTELKWLLTKLGGTRGLDGKDYVFSHCDLLSGNVIMHGHPASEKTATNGDAEVCVSFIDYEYATPAPAAFDISNHFAEWAGFDCDHNYVPTKSARRDFLQSYVRSFRQYSRLSPENAEDATKAMTVADDDAEINKDVDEIYAQVDLFRGVPGLYWGVWALVQETISQIDFDYATFARLKLGEYFDWKAELDGTRAKEEKKLGVREAKWAQE